MMSRFFLFLTILLPVLVSSQEFPAKLDQLVSDYAGVLNDQELAGLEELVARYDQETSVQIAVVIMRTLEGYPIDDYAFELGERWGIGQANTDNGALVLVSIDERKIWIATGYGLEATLPDALIKRIIENEITPQFKGGRYFHGLKSGVDAMILATKGEYEGQGNGNSGSRQGKQAIPLIIFIGFIWLIVMATKGLQVKRYAGMNGLSFWTAWMLLNSSRRRHGGSWSSFSGGSGGFSGGGGFGGFGGGSFGGGGAGGSW